jgi:DNA polymerase-3 subunit gamma/tau
VRVAYLSLYRKYRSQTFAEIIGQPHVTTTLAHAVAEDRLHHAYLFTGPRGTGKTSTARILAKAVNCESGPTATPCNACAQCEAITAGSSVDVIEIDAASHGGVDDVRDLRERVAFAPASARRKVYIVDECHMLSTAGWNAFLKTVEEPPGHVLFVFATTEPHKVLDTILSRTQRFDFKRIGAQALAAHVGDLGQREGLTFEPGAVDLIVRAGDGSARDTLSVLDQVVAFTGATVTAEGVAEVLGTVPEALLAETADAIAGGDAAALCVLVGRLADAGVDLRSFARDAVEHLRQLLLSQVSPDVDLVEGTPERLARLRAQAGRLGRVELLRAVELLAEAQAQMRRGNTRLPLEIALVKAALPDACGDAAALAARLDRLERRAQLPVAPPAPDPVEETPAPATPAAPEPAAPAPAAQPAPAPEEQPAPAAEPTQAPGPAPVPALDLDALHASWPAVLDGVRARSVRQHAYVAPGRVARLTGETLELHFPPDYAFHAENCASDEVQRTLADVLEAVLGVRLRLTCRLSDGAEADSATAPDPADDEAVAVAEAEASAAVDDREAHALAVERLTRELGATILGEE